MLKPNTGSLLRKTLINQAYGRQCTQRGQSKIASPFRSSRARTPRVCRTINHSVQTPLWLPALTAVEHTHQTGIINHVLVWFRPNCQQNAVKVSCSWIQPQRSSRQPSTPSPLQLRQSQKDVRVTPTPATHFAVGTSGVSTPSMASSANFTYECTFGSS